jgi:hypothetical protein
MIFLLILVMLAWTTNVACNIVQHILFHEIDECI